MNNKMIARELVRLAKELNTDRQSSLKQAAFTRQHYTAVANILSRYAKNNTALIEAFADLFESDNPRFSRERFIDAV